MRTFTFCLVVLAGLATSAFSQSSVSNVAMMVAIPSPTSGQIVDVAGYYAASDGGGGRFVWDSASNATIDEGLVFGGTGAGRWIRQVAEGTLNVKMFGAQSGEEVENATAIQNTERIQRALDAAADGGHETLHFVGGYYKLGRPVANDVNNLGSGFEQSSPFKIFAHADEETGITAFYYLRMGAHQNSIRPRIRLAGEGATLEGSTLVQTGSSVLIIRTKFTSVEVDGITFRTATIPGSNLTGRYHGITILPMQVPPTQPYYYAQWWTDVPPAAETQQLRDEPTESITIRNSRFINCRNAIATPVIPRRDVLTFAGNLQVVNVQNCEFLYPNGSDSSDGSDTWPSAALTFSAWVGTLNVADCVFDGATTGDATPGGSNGNNRGPVDNFIFGGGLRNVVERNTIKHAGVEGMTFPRFDEVPGLSSTVNGSSTVSVDANRSFVLEFSLNNAGYLTFPQDLPPTLRSQLVGVRVRFAATSGNDSSSSDFGEYEISQVMQDGQGMWNRIRLVTTGDPKNLAANSSFNMVDPVWGPRRLYLAPSELRKRDMERTATIKDNFIGGGRVTNNAGLDWYCTEGIRADNYRLTVTGNLFDRCLTGVLLIGHSYADEAVSGTLIDRNEFELVDYSGDSNLPQEDWRRARAALIMAPGVRVTNNAIHSATNKRVDAVYAVWNCGDLSIIGNSITADRKLSLPESDKGYAVSLNNNLGALSSGHEAYVANNHFRNLDYGISTGGSPAVSSNFSLAGGSASTPSFNFGVNGDADTGIFQPGVSSIGIAVDGSLVAKFDSSGIDAAEGSNSQPGYSFDGDDATGMYHPAGNTIAFATNGSERMRIEDSGVTINGSATISGNLALGGGASIKKIVHVKGVQVAIGIVSSLGSKDTVVNNSSLDGFAAGDTVILNPDPSSTIATRVCYSAFIPAAGGKVTIRATNASSSDTGSISPTFTITVISYGP